MNSTKFVLVFCSVSHVQVVGQPLLPQFDVEINESTGKCTLKYFPETDCCLPPQAYLKKT